MPMPTHDFLLVRRPRRLRMVVWAMGCLLAALAIAWVVVGVMERYYVSHSDPHVYIRK